MSKLNNIAYTDEAGVSQTLTVLNPPAGSEPASLQNLATSIVAAARPSVAISRQVNSTRTTQRLNINIGVPVPSEIADKVVLTTATARVTISLPMNAPDPHRANLGLILRGIFDDTQVQQAIVDGAIS